MEKRDGYMHEDMKRHRPPGEDSSMKPPKGSVDSDPVRSGVAEGSNKTLGPRTA